MPMRTRTRCIVSFTALAIILMGPAAGCGGGGGGEEDVIQDPIPDYLDQIDQVHDPMPETTDTPNDPSGGLTLQQFCEAYENRYQPWLDYYDRCCSAEDKASDEYDTLAFYADNEPDVAQCIADFQSQIDSGSIAFDGARAQECVDILMSNHGTPPADCTGLPWIEQGLTNRGTPSLVQIPACRATLAGQIGEGEPCVYNLDCREGLRCQEVGEDFVCAPTVTLGGSCQLQDDCVDDLFCVGAPDSKTCGELSGPYGGCGFSFECQDNLMCDYGDHTCFRPAEAGATCGTDLPDCILGTYCDFNTDRCVELSSAGGQCMFAFVCKGRCNTVGQVCVSMCGSE